MIIGTAGHIDHGKTALVRALTGVDTDRLKEEKARGITIDLGFAYLPAPDGQVLGFVDVPGHEKFVHNMLAGAGGIDFVLLVVAADDGVMPQTREHLAIVDLLGIESRPRRDDQGRSRRGRPARGGASGDRARAREDRARRQRHRAGVRRERRRHRRAARPDCSRKPTTAERSAPQGRFRLAVDRSFTLTGVGTVVTGTVLSGAIAIGDHVTVSPSGLSARVRSIHAQNRPAERGLAGERCALNLAGDGIAKDAHPPRRCRT